MSTLLPALPDGHQHRLPEPVMIAALLDRIQPGAFPDRAAALRPIRLILAALSARCERCQRSTTTWLAREGDPWTAMQLAVPMALDARLVARSLLGHARELPSRVRQVLTAAFDGDVAEVVTPIAVHRNIADAADRWRALETARRYQVIRAFLHGIAHPAPGPIRRSVRYDNRVTGLACDTDLIPTVAL